MNKILERNIYWKVLLLFGKEMGVKVLFDGVDVERLCDSAVGFKIVFPVE